MNFWLELFPGRATEKTAESTIKLWFKVVKRAKLYDSCSNASLRQLWVINVSYDNGSLSHAFVSIRTRKGRTWMWRIKWTCQFGTYRIDVEWSFKQCSPFLEHAPMQVSLFAFSLWRSVWTQTFAVRLRECENFIS